VDGSDAFVFSVVCQVAAMPYFYKPFGQDMLLKSSCEFFLAYSHLLLFIVICIIFVSKRNGGAGDLFYAMGCYGCFVREIEIEETFKILLKQINHPIPIDKIKLWKGD
jgi:hypothetical protein